LKRWCKVSTCGLNALSPMVMARLPKGGITNNQQQHEWVMLLQGEAVIVFDDEEEPCYLYAGDCLLIAAHRAHQVRWTKPNAHTIWLAVFFDD